VPLDPATSGSLVTEAFLIGAYCYLRYRTSASSTPPAPEHVALGGVDSVVVERSRIVAEATNLARDLTNTPPNDLTPSALADFAREQAGLHDFQVRVMEKEELAAGRFGGLVGVGAGSANPPVLIELSVGEPTGPHTAVVGKGITFDSGGLDLKRLTAMSTMKCDMAGAAAVLAAVTAMGQLGGPVPVRAYLACAENMLSGSAMRPGDVLTHRNGMSAELVSPDAEGRLVLADALAYAAEHGPDRIIDVATLTGSTALGADLWAVMATDRALSADLIEAGNAAGEPGWELPLWTKYRPAILSEVADVKNFKFGITQDFGSILGALYLREFVNGRPWAHVDIGETAFREDASDLWAAGATGSLTRTLIGYLLQQK
jgi:leucyl aminopeptidase